MEREMEIHVSMKWEGDSDQLIFSDTNVATLTNCMWIALLHRHGHDSIQSVISKRGMKLLVAKHGLEKVSTNRYTEAIATDKVSLNQFESFTRMFVEIQQIMDSTKSLTIEVKAPDVDQIIESKLCIII